MTRSIRDGGYLCFPLPAQWSCAPQLTPIKFMAPIAVAPVVGRDLPMSSSAEEELLDDPTGSETWSVQRYFAEPHRESFAEKLLPASPVAEMQPFAGDRQPSVILPRA